MNDLANSWKVGLAFMVLVGLRFLLTSQGISLQNARTAIFGSIAGLFGSARRRRSAPDREEAEEAERVVATAVRSPAEQMRNSILEFVDSGLIALVLVFMIIRPFFVQAFYIPSGSMRPTLVENDKILVNKFVYHFREPQRGDVVVFKAPPAAAADEKDFIKRLIGLPGDVIEVRDGLVHINGSPLHEDYTAEPPRYTMAPVMIEPGMMFVMGDNRNDSNDSHSWGQLEGNRIRGKANFIFWPIPRVGVIR